MSTFLQKLIFLWNNKPGIFIILILTISFFYLRFDKYIGLRPMSDHVWAQCDRASVARNYADQSMNFFLPRVHYTCGGNGIVGLEFPAVNYFVAILYKCFGFNEIYYRFTMLLIVFSGLFALMKITNLFLKNLFVSILLVLSWYLSPVLTYYTPNFLPDAASMGFVLIAWYYFFKEMKNPGRKNLIMYFVTGALACLIKITSSISIITIILVSILNFFLSPEKQFFKRDNSKKFIILSVIILVLTGGWYYYASYLNSTYKSGVFLMKTKPPGSYHELIFDIQFLWYRFSKLYYNIAFYILYVASFLILVFYIRKTNKLLLAIVISMYLGSLAFFVLMVRQFIQHEYYIITLLPAFFFHLLCVAEVLKRQVTKTSMNYCIGIALSSVVIISAIPARKFLKGRFSETGAVNSGTQDFMVYRELEPYLRKLGIRPEQEVISYFDVSPNCTLYLMNQRGWTIPFGKDSSSLVAVTRIKADYVIFNDKYSNETKLPDFILNQKIGQYKTISIYKKTDPAK